MTDAKVREQYSLRANLCSKRGNQGIITKNWWVLVFISICGLVYFNSVSKKNEILATLDQHLESLNNEKAALLEEKEDLLLQINSQSDPNWIQLTLMKGLGLVPEGQLKVYFCSKDD
jgi:hypothetical protein